MPLAAKIISTVVFFLLFALMLFLLYVVYKKNENKPLKHHGYWVLVISGFAVIFLVVGIYSIFW